MTGRVVCVGHVMVDVIAELAEPLALHSDTAATVRYRQGGSAANAAAWCAWAGEPAMFVGRVGEDEAGRGALEQLQRHGVELAVTVDPVAPTGTCIVLVEPNGERSMIPSAGANARLEAGDLPALRPGDWLHVSGYLLLDAATVASARAAFAAAAQAGVRVSVDASSTQPLRRFGVEAFLEAVPDSATLLANADEATVLTGADNPHHAALLLAERGGTVVVKLGAAGAVVADDKHLELIAGHRAHVVDTTGAGDAFAAGFLGARRRGADSLEAARAGVDLGAQAVAIRGARPD